MGLTNYLRANLKHGVYYIGGTQSFMEDKLYVLLELGIDHMNIHREVLGPESLSHLINK
jgi:nitric oxide dioxygenase